MPESSATAGTKDDLVFGRIAVRKSYATLDQVRECLEIQGKLRELEIEPKRIGEILLEKGYLREEQAGQIQKIQEHARANPTPVPSSPAVSAHPSFSFSLPGFEILEKIGQGAMGAVYKARQLSMDRLVAIKVLSRKPGTDKSFVERFIHEARAVAKLNHENIIAGIDVGAINGLHYFVMEYVDGEPVSSLLRRKGRLEENECLRIGLQVLHALIHANENGLVHRDIKPENIMIAQNGVAKLCDLGLAKQTKGGGAHLTLEGVSVGTPNYISPEQARGEQRIDVRSDLYSLGASLYHMATGTPPFSGPNPMVIMTKHVTDQPEAPQKRCPAVSEGFGAVLLKMMRKRREDRYQLPEAAAADLEALFRGNRPSAAETRPAAVPGTRRIHAKADPIRTRRFVRRRSSAPYVLGGVILVLAGLATWRFAGGGTSAPAEKDKRETREEGDRLIEGGSFASDRDNFRKYWKGLMARQAGRWIQRIHARGEEYLRLYRRKPDELRMADLVQESRAAVDKLILDRVWGDLHREAEAARGRGRYAEALKKAESLPEEYRFFRTEEPKVLTQAGARRAAYLTRLREEEIPRAYLEAKKRILDAKGDEAFALIDRMAERFGSGNAGDLSRLRAEVVEQDLRRRLAPPLTLEKLVEAEGRLRVLGERFRKEPALSKEIALRLGRIAETKETLVREAGPKAAQLYDKEFAPSFLRAMARRDLAQARRSLHEIYFGAAAAPAWPVIRGRDLDLAELKRLLDPARIAPADYSKAIRMLEATLKGAEASAVRFHSDLRAYVLLEELIDMTGRGAELQVADAERFRDYSPVLRGVESLRRGGAGKILVSSKGAQERIVYLAPKDAPWVPEEDLVRLARRSDPERARRDPYFPLRAGLLHYYAGQKGQAAGWFQKVIQAPATVRIEFYRDLVKNVPTPEMEAEAKAMFRRAVTLFPRRTEVALKICKELESRYAATVYLTTRIDEAGREMERTRLEVIRVWLRDLGEKKDSPKGSTGKIFEGDVTLQGNKVAALYQFAKKDLTADFAQFRAAALQATNTPAGVRLRGTGFWYWKAPLRGDVHLRMVVVSHAEQGIGAVVHGVEDRQGYAAIADYGSPIYRLLAGQSVIFKYPFRGIPRWQEFLLAQGSRSLALQKGKRYEFVFRRRGEQVALEVDGQVVATAADGAYRSGRAGVALVDSDVTIKRLKIEGEIDPAWLEPLIK